MAMEMEAAATRSGSPARAAPFASASAPRKRDIRLDIFRGLALLLITVTHTGGNWLAEFLPSHFGFSSGTEMFVFCSGIASGLAFGGLYVKRGFWMGTMRVAYRIWQIYWVHIAAFIGVLALTIFLAGWFGKPEYIAGLQQDVLLTHPRQAILGLLTLSYLPPLFDILPLYVALLAMIPLVMAARRLSPTLPFILAGAAYVYLWTVGGPLLPANPTDPSQHWLFNPFGWQLLFFGGFFIAMGWVKVPAPGTPWAVATAATIVLASVPLSWHVLYDNFGLLSYLREAVLPLSERPNLHLLRIVHFLALAYLALSIAAAYPRMLTTGAARVLAMTGRETLAVFIASIPVAILGGTAIDVFGSSLSVVASVTLLGWGALILTAFVASFIKAKPWTRPAPLAAAEAEFPVGVQPVRVRA